MYIGVDGCSVGWIGIRFGEGSYEADGLFDYTGAFARRSLPVRKLASAHAIERVVSW